MPKVRGHCTHGAKACVPKLLRELFGRRKCLDRFRQVVVGARMLRDDAADERKNRSGNTRGRNCEAPASAAVKIPESRACRPDAALAQFRGTPAPGCSTLRMPKPIVVASTDASRSGMRVASPRMRSMAGAAAGPPPRILSCPICSIAAEKSTPITRLARALTAHRRKSEIGRARAEIEHGFTSGQLQHINRLPSPSLVESRAEQMIQEVVSLGDRIEHSGNT